jgi:hypothetical protein
MFSTLIVVLLCYMLYDGVKRLIEHEEAFGGAEWATLALCIVYVPVIIFSGIRAFKKGKDDKEKRKEEEEKQRAELDERKRRMFLDESDEMEYKTEEEDEDYYDDEDEDVIEADSAEADDE